jgi:glucose-6-phosphate 1-epimerase
VVWNPWPEGSASLGDLDADEWSHFLCAEAANTGTDSIVLGPGATHTMSITLAAGAR